ncbi:BON domain-containing protein [Pseudochryseolinea flava]|uniref:BON domain-containing protein n=1 Tax=Pseudochryseolinea flava TaxID=2059302 RepID=A0A364Y2A3_9BACT|nr:BON domain-containing protein [Pseudochryseolinea flava]RAW00090.1 hypothetical protein DQQ10_16200 [Pseudochryseolinea flava]
MKSGHENDFVVRGQYAFQHNRIDPRIRNNDFQYQRGWGKDADRVRRGAYDRYQFYPREFYNSIQREGRAYDLAANYRRQDAMAARNSRRDAKYATDYSPKRNVTRRDESIADDIYIRLTEHGDLDASEMMLDVTNGVVVISGYVDSRASKRLAEDICEHVRGVQQVENRLRVQPPLGNGVSIGR